MPCIRHAARISVKVMPNPSTLEKVYFWKTMYTKNWVYLFDRSGGGGAQHPRTLSVHIKNLTFDPYRSIAWSDREHHGYLKNNAPFSQQAPLPSI